MKNSIVINYYYVDLLISVLLFVTFDKQKNKTRNNIDTNKVLL